jgi:RNA polymerase sigma-70 factor (sigma-E family)
VDDAGFREFASARLDRIRHTAYLICGDWHTADDVVSTALLKLYKDWRRVSQVENLDAYLRRALVNAWLDDRRRPWRREKSVSELPHRAVPAEDGSVNERLTVLQHLAALPPRQRAVIVLRFYCEVSVEETAQILQCSQSTVKTQTARALDTLRSSIVDVSDLA